MIDGVRCMLMRGGTSKGAYFVAQDLPADQAERDALLLRIMGSPHPLQIDGVGGGHPLMSKVAVVNPNDEGGVDYLFLQIGVDEPVVSAKQNCGNILAGVGPFAVERGLVRRSGSHVRVPIRLLNSGGTATATALAGDEGVVYEGGTAIDGVAGTAAPVVIDFAGTAGSTPGALLPTGNRVDNFEGVRATCIDNGMPVVVLPAAELGILGNESPADLEAKKMLRSTVESIRLAAGAAMGLGNVADATVPKMTTAAPPRQGGVLSTRTFIPHRVHTSIGVLGAASVAAAAALDGTVAHEVAVLRSYRMGVEHPTGVFEVEVELDGENVVRTGAVRTTRKLFDGKVFPR